MKYLLLIGLLISNVAAAECVSKMATTTQNDEVISTSTVVVCADGKVPPKIEKRIQIGDTVLEEELPKVPEIKPAYFQYNHSKCRLFREKYVYQNKLRVNHGVVCQTDEKENVWQVVDKW